MRNQVLCAVMVSCILLLSACSSAEYKESMENGVAAFNAGDYPTAIKAYERALEEEPGDTEAEKNLAVVNAKYFEVLYAEGTEALKAKNFTEASDMLQTAYDINPTGEEDLLDQLTVAKDLLKKQTELDAYAKWLNDASTYNYDLLKEWRSISDNYSTGQINLEEFTKRAKAMLSKSNDLLTISEGAILEISGGLATAHAEYLREMQNNHNAIHNTIIATQNEEEDPKKIIAAGKSIANIQIQQSNHIQSLKSYAKAEGITFSEK